MLTASGTTCNGYSGYTTEIIVNSGGQLTASNSIFAASLDEVYLNSGSTDTIQFSSFATQLAINSGTSISINSDDLTNATVVAVGNASATIDLENNYWGTTVTAQIAAKITDYNSAPIDTRPLVLYTPFLSAPAELPVANSQSATTNEGMAQAITLTSTGPNGDPLTYQVISGPSSGTLTGSGASRTYTPNAGFSGSDSFAFTVTDTTTGLVSNTATVSITVTPPPVADSQSVTTKPGVAKRSR